MSSQSPLIKLGLTNTDSEDWGSLASARAHLYYAVCESDHCRMLITERDGKIIKQRVREKMIVFPTVAPNNMTNCPYCDWALIWKKKPRDG